MRKYSLLLISLFFMLLMVPSPARSISDHVRVGVYQNTPLTFEENGKTKGFFIDIKGKKVAVLRNDISFKNLRELVNQSGTKCRFIEAFEYEDVLELVEIGRCEAGLVSQIYGLQRERDYDIIKSSIFLSPQKLYWAAPTGGS